MSQYILNILIIDSKAQGPRDPDPLPRRYGKVSCKPSKSMIMYALHVLSYNALSTRSYFF